ncbi:MAG TPA: glutathione S-transferase family protein [Geminicoccaceae bacterium]|nr:glutathione S-transferase family protein [Geminicoccus sp.]HMU49931.1 glutathione S-transferase family protein [Geminicoccaceae bacterium]
MQLTLVIGSRNISSWSLRPWMALRQGGVPFEEVVVALRRPDTARILARWSPSAKVPVLLIDGRPIWDSLAICELAAELAPDLWPADPIARAHARSVSSEMHSGFMPLRRFLPMDFIARFAAPGRLLRDVAKDIARIEAIWIDCRERHADDGPFLFGKFGVADAMFAPVVSRFLTYGIELGEIATSYMTVVRSLPAWEEWSAAAALDEEQGPAPAAVAAWSAALSQTPAQAFARDDRAASAAAAPHLVVDGPPVPGGAPASPAGQPLSRPRSSRPSEIKPIGDGIHRRR